MFMSSRLLAFDEGEIPRIIDSVHIKNTLGIDVFISSWIELMWKNTVHIGVFSLQTNKVLA